MSVVLHIITGLNDGGAEAVLYRICRNDEQNTHVVVSMMDEGKYGLSLRDAGVMVHCLNAARGKITYGSLRHLWRILRSVRPDIVQTWMYHANLIGGTVAYFAGARRIVWSIRHASLSRDDSKLTTRIIDRLSAVLSHVIPQKIVAISNKVAEVHLAKGYAAKFALIYNGCDTSAFSPNSAHDKRLASEFGLNPEVPIIGCVARWTPEKDHATFLKAIALASRASPLQAVLVGTGCTRENESLWSYIRKLGIENLVFPIGPRQDIPDIMNLLDIHVLPSKNEAFGNVIIESMSSGTPCISTSVGDAAHIIGDTGWIINPQDPAMMSNAIKSAISEWKDKDKWHHRKAISRRRIVDFFSIQRMVKEYNSIWNSSL